MQPKPFSFKPKRRIVPAKVVPVPVAEPEPPAPKQRKKRRLRPGTKVRRDMKRIQKDYKHKQIPRANFERLVREIGRDFVPDIRWSAEAISALQEEAEEVLTDFFEKGDALAHMMGKKTMKPLHLRLARKWVLNEEVVERQRTNRLDSPPPSHAAPQQAP
jgi:histone H3/H4